MAKQLLTPLRLIARMNFSVKNYGCELLNLTGTVGKVELISTFTPAVCESWNVSNKYTWDNGGDLKQLSMDQTLSKAWSPYSCNGRKHRRKHVSDSVPSSYDAREHFDYNIASLTGIVFNCSVSSSCSDRSNH